MEIVAATILHQQSMLSEFAFAALVVLAVISTTLTGPMLHALAPKPGARKPATLPAEVITTNS